jgi:hypothetical protein
VIQGGGSAAGACNVTWSALAVHAAIVLKLMIDPITRVRFIAFMRIVFICVISFYFTVTLWPGNGDLSGTRADVVS